MTIKVKLEWYEAEMAAHVGVSRNISCIKKGLLPAHGAKIEDQWTMALEGACGEIAVAKVLNTYWHGPVDTFKKGFDVGNYQVRARQERKDRKGNIVKVELIVRDDDRDDDIFIFVVGTCPNYEVMGWIEGRRAKQAHWSEDYGNREAAYFIPREHLNPIEDLPELASKKVKEVKEEELFETVKIVSRF